jgi:hypothetical protein
MSIFENHDEQLYSLLERLDSIFKETGGIVANLVNLSDLYSKYGKGIIEITTLENLYLEKTEKKDAAEAIDKTSHEARGLRQELRELGNNLDFKERPRINAELATIGKQMKYTNPSVWLIYKKLAYNPSLPINQKLIEIGKPVSSPVNTVEELIKHGLMEEGYICGRRLHFLALKYAEKHGLTNYVQELKQLNPWKMLPSDFNTFADIFTRLGLDTQLLDLLQNNEFVDFCANIQLEWQNFELDGKGKWMTYPLSES